jgi:hypothetical protein
VSEATEADVTPEVEGAQTAPPEASQAPDPTADLETAARAGGWVPKDEFKGDPDKWLDAPHFVLKAAEILPHVTKELREARAEIKSVQKTLKDFGEHHSRTAQREYERALKDIQARIDYAASQGDVEGVRAGTDELVELNTEAKGGPRPVADAVPPEFEEWREANPWFGRDKALTAATAAIAEEVTAEGYAGKAQIREVDRRIREVFPEKFAKPENPNRNNAPAVEGAGAPKGPRGKTFSDLPPDAKAMALDFEKRGVMPRDKYAKEFFSQ